MKSFYPCSENNVYPYLKKKLLHISINFIRRKKMNNFLEHRKVSYHIFKKRKSKNDQTEKQRKITTKFGLSIILFFCLPMVVGSGLFSCSRAHVPLHNLNFTIKLAK